MELKNQFKQTQFFKNTGIAALGLSIGQTSYGEHQLTYQTY